MDNELFELCKEAYEKTGWYWRHPERCLYAVNGVEMDLNTVRVTDHARTDVKFIAPVYTSDFLLDKLPSTIESHEYPDERATLWTRKNDDHLDKHPEGRITYFAWYFVTGKVDGVSDFGECADTPLKALLKLTLALHKTGELTQEGTV